MHIKCLKLNISLPFITEINDSAKQFKEQKFGIDTLLYGNTIFFIAASVYGE